MGFGGCRVSCLLVLARVGEGEKAICTAPDAHGQQLLPRGFVEMLPNANS